MKPIFFSIIFAAVLIVAALAWGGGNGSSGDPNIPADNVNIVGDRQVIEIKAKGGYSPRASTAKAGIPTILRFNTKGTFDCSSSVRIPSMNISKILPGSGVTEINLGNPTIGTLQGSCGMGMYPFEVKFEG